jgi:hypothetical protein
MDQQALTGDMPERPQARGSSQVRPVGFGRILYGQHQGHSVEATVSSLNMALDNIGGLNVIVSKEAIGGFEHGAAATGFGQSGTGILRQDLGQLDQALGPPQIAEVSVGKLGDGPVGSIGDVGHNRLLCQRVGLGVAVRCASPSIPQVPLK